MHDVILAFFFISLIVTPALLASVTGKEPAEPKAAPVREAKPKSTSVRREAMKSGRLSYASTLPLHGTRALAGR
jgi:hypothetical protein